MSYVKFMEWLYERENRVTNVNIGVDEKTIWSSLHWYGTWLDISYNESVSGNQRQWRGKFDSSLLYWGFWTGGFWRVSTTLNKSLSKFVMILRTLADSLFNFWNYLVWRRITDEGSVPEMRILSILLIKSDLKWCIHLSKSLFLYFNINGQSTCS